ncbi:UDP-N-acetylglucosamine 2-epimerase [Pseudomarimonas arenosa]|uniref:UDP-N-acetylglucosamine 2-epimerase (Hydrolyzing) n=1 Tax=Pseudomarimonas arenosa TaxID=2774145 RepID=A0AAW3ZLU6_9GAMM|nr:UDP-N-acetylglucosamine 2-epimerase [Pseudomarimonas arenosa]MBD8526504.1 UDP-N-acetylglucosamine 2-epimerase (hydrolyzing) [Pseudomarimonas arenosa]
MADTQRRIAVISSSRADYGHLYWVLRGLQSRPNIDLRIYAIGAHLSPHFGATWQRFAEDGFELTGRFECLLDSDSDVGMAKTIGLASLSLADALAAQRPDLLLLIADRYEMLAPASVALALRIPIAHIEGGEVSEGAIDDAVRNALTKLSHLHFVPTENARRRVLAMGEEAWRVHRVGAPSLDHVRRSELPSAEALSARLQMPLQLAPLVVAWHPVTLLADPAAEAECLFSALRVIGEHDPRPVVFCFPNADAGREAIIRRAQQFCAHRPSAKLFVNLEHREYWALLLHAAALIGNSSSGIMETPSLALPCVNIGDRQAGRERAANILDAPAEASAIVRAIERALNPAFRQGLQGMHSPYGDGDAGERIAGVLAEVELGPGLLRKRALPLQPQRDAFEQAH